MGIVYALLIFTVVVTVHELGHFLLAKWNHIEVTEFAIGMGPKLIGKQIGETLYSIRLFPLGGFCAMGEDETENLSENNFNKKSVWARISVIAAGPIFNFILAFLLSMIIVGFSGYSSPVLEGVEPGTPAAESGIQAGDKLVKINNKRIYEFKELRVYMMMHPSDSIEITVKRDGELKAFKMDLMKTETGSYKIGVIGEGTKKANLLQIIGYGANGVRYWIDQTLASLKMLITGAVGMDQLSGPVGIATLVDDSYQQTKDYGVSAVVMTFINIGILLAANLGVMNLLPIPALDGGRLLFLFIEAIKGSRVAPQKEGFVHFVGFALLMVLMVFVMFNDLKRIFL